MLTPLLGVEGGRRQSSDLLSPSPKEHNYFDFSDSSSDESSTVSDKLNLKATELRLGLPGSQSPPRSGGHDELDEKPLFPLTPLKEGIALFSQRGSKRGFADDTKEHFDGFFKTLTGHDSDVVGIPLSQNKLPLNASHGPESKEPSRSNINNTAPASKAQVVGWPPVRSFRKNNVATPSKNNEPLFVKVSMDGAPYLRKVDLRAYTTYQELSSGLEKMFSCFTQENVLAYEDKDGDWMLVGDVPWEMFIDSCKRLKIMKSCDAIGLGPRTMEKTKSQV